MMRKYLNEDNTLVLSHLNHDHVGPYNKTFWARMRP